MKKKITLIALLCLICTIVLSSYLQVNKTNSKFSINHFEIILGEKCNEKSFLISVDDYDYFLDGYEVENSFVIINENGDAIKEEDILYAKEKIDSNIFSYKKGENIFKIYKLKDALYNSIIDATWLKKYYYVNIFETKIQFEKFEIEKYTNLKKEEFIDEKNRQKMELIHLSMNITIIDNQEIKSPKDFINNGYKFDYLINQISKKYYLSLVKAKGKYTSNELRIYEIDDYNIGVEYGFVDDYLTYYVYLIDI